MILKKTFHTLEAGCDEAGRGCLSGPVVAAAVILPEDFSNDLLTDSKKLTEKQRAVLKEVIERESLAYGVAFVYPEQIDQINILQASILAMHKALDQLDEVQYILVDGNKFNNYNKIPHETVIKGDGKYLNIAAASVLAKTYRDAYMETIDKEYPEYQWAQNKGYPTQSHRNAIRQIGLSPYHRKSFKQLPTQTKLNF